MAVPRTPSARPRCVADRHGAMDDGGPDMSQKSKDILSKGILAAIAMSLTFGAAQYALGRDLSGTGQGSFEVAFQVALGTSEAVINRAAKADRAGAAAAVEQTRTISLRFEGLPDTSVLVRVPVAKEARNNSAPSLTKSGARKITVACEPVVSVLTEVAKQLQPGRCVT
jgi:hypothetical protein